MYAPPASIVVGCGESALDPARVVMLGTGAPNADSERSGPSMTIVNAGPELVRPAAATAMKRELPAVVAAGDSEAYP
jgi:hypothetical protein